MTVKRATAVIMEICLLQRGLEDSQQIGNEANMYELDMARSIGNFVPEGGMKYYLDFLGGIN